MRGDTAVSQHIASSHNAMNKNLSHLKLLSIFHFICGALGLLFSSMFILHLVIGIILIVSPETMSDNGEGPPAFFGYLFAGIGGLFFLLGAGVSICIIYSGILLRKRKKHLFSFVIACVQCIFMPFGTLLGIFTIIVLSKDSVKRLYGIEIEEE